MKKSIKYKSGFTLIEVVVYLALFALLMGGAVVAAYNIIEGSARSQTRAQMQEEGEFLLGKISWAMTGVQSVTSPTAGSQNAILTVSKYSGASVTVSLAGTDVQIQDMSGTSLLNNSNMQISGLVFTHTNQTGGGVSPESLQVAFTLNARTPNGMPLSQEFSNVVYLRK